MRSLLVPITFVLLACGSSTTDPLVGTWKYSSAQTTMTWTFTSDKVWSSIVVGTDPTTQCSETTKQKGTWATSGDQLTITASSGTVGVTGCSNASQDQAEAPDPNLDTSAKTSTCAIYGDMLTDTPMGATNSVTFTRQ